MPKQKQNHVPVLLDEVLKSLAPKAGETYLDLTAGYGGHASKILEITKSNAILVDRDPNAVLHLRQIFNSASVQIINKDFLSASKMLSDKKKSYDLILADLGVSSPHLDNPSRGFSIANDGPLDMRMDPRQELNAWNIVNQYSEKELSQILRDYGEEPKYRRIAKLVVENRPIDNTEKLGKVVAKAWPGHSRTHPATRTFQALRIAVNDEINQLIEALPLWKSLLNKNGRLAIISFHSLEDVEVKRYFSENGGDRYDAELEVLNKRPITASEHELVFNPRARSAKLRVSKRK